jgi:hypothetical protein
MVEVQISEQGTFEFIMDKFDIIMTLVALGFSIALVVVVVTASVRAGWKLWPWILGLGFLAWLFI